MAKYLSDVLGVPGYVGPVVPMKISMFFYFLINHININVCSDMTK